MKKVKVAFLFLTVSFFLMFAWSANALEWVKTYGGASSVYSAQQTSDGGYIMAGHTNSFGIDNDVYVLKLDASGNIAWHKTYAGVSADYALSVQQTSDGGYIVAGSTISFDGAGYGPWVLKLDASGNVTWQKTYGGANWWGYASSIQQTSDGGYIVAGVVAGYGINIGAGDRDISILKLDASGNITWQKTYGGVGGEAAYSTQQTSDGGYIVAGSTGGSFGAGNGSWVLKLDASGNIAWQKTYGGVGGEAAYSIQQTLDGGYIAAGYSFSSSASLDAWVLKLDASGNISWQKTYGGVGGEGAYSIRQTSDGGYIVAGGTNSFGAGNGDAWLLKLDASGNITWQKTYGGVGSEGGSSIQQTSDGGYIVAGGTTSFGAVGGDVWVLKLDANGEIADCAAIGTSDATVTNTSVFGNDTAATVTTPSAAVADTNATVISVFVTPRQQCPSAPAYMVEIDIKPGSYPNAIKIKDTGTIPVVVFGSSAFDVATIDIGTLELNGAMVKIIKGKGYQASYEDINNDGMLDLLVHFNRGEAQLIISDTSATLTGTTADGKNIRGTDSVKVIE